MARRRADGSAGGRPGGLISAGLAADRLGAPAVVFFTMAGAAPLTVVAGVVTTGYATTGVVGIPLAFALVGVLLAVFAVGYVAMARHMANAGAFYAYIAHGIGRPVGVGAAWVALGSYNLLQVGLYGAVGAAAGPVLEQWLGISPPWWVIALIAWATTGLVGMWRVDVNSRLLGVLLICEVAVIIVYSLADVHRPANDKVTFGTLTPHALFGPGLGALLVLAVLGYVGFESSVVFSEEAKRPDRTVRLATYIAIALTGGLYTLAAWAMSVATGASGPAGIVAASRAEGTELIFNVAADRIGQGAADLGHVLFVTSIAAALISFHNTTARYAFALGREHILPGILGRTSRRTGAPVVASLLQSTVGFAVIVVYAAAGWDPVVQLFYWLGTTGGIGILTLLTLTAFAVIGYFRGSRPRTRHTPRDRTLHRETTWTARTAPALAAAGLSVTFFLALTNLPVLLGVRPGHPLTIAIPVTLLASIALGACWGLHLRARRPQVYAAIGLGARSVIVTASPAIRPDRALRATTRGRTDLLSGRQVEDGRP